MFKILNGEYDEHVKPKLHTCCKIQEQEGILWNLKQLKLDKKEGTDRIVCVWDCLPNNIVNAVSRNSFKEKKRFILQWKTVGVQLQSQPLLHWS